MPDEEVRSEKVDSNADGVGPVLHFREYGRHGRRRDRRRKCGKRDRHGSFCSFDGGVNGKSIV